MEGSYGAGIMGTNEGGNTLESLSEQLGDLSRKIDEQNTALKGNIDGIEGRVEEGLRSYVNDQIKKAAPQPWYIPVIRSTLMGAAKVGCWIAFFWALNTYIIQPNKQEIREAVQGFNASVQAYQANYPAKPKEWKTGKVVTETYKDGVLVERVTNDGIVYGPPKKTGIEKRVE